jgi:hypothetical protein
LPSCYPPEYLIYIGFTDFRGPNGNAQAPRLAEGEAARMERRNPWRIALRLCGIHLLDRIHATHSKALTFDGGGRFVALYAAPLEIDLGSRHQGAV